MMRAHVLLAIFVVALLASTGGFAKDGDLRPFKRGSWQEIRQAHAGRPTVVHFWGLTCGPCRVEMPQCGGSSCGSGPISIWSRSTLTLIPNQVEDASEMLARTGLAGAENWIFDDPFTERLRFEIDPRCQGEIPRTM